MECHLAGGQGFVAQMAKGDSSCESSVVAGVHEQTHPAELQDQELAGLGRCRKAAREAGLRDSEINAFLTEATAGDYDHLLQTAMRWFDVL